MPAINLDYIFTWKVQHDKKSVLFAHALYNASKLAAFSDQLENFNQIIILKLVKLTVNGTAMFHSWAKICR